MPREEVPWFRSVWEDRLLVLACTATAVLVAAAYSFSIRPRYEASAEVELGAPMPRPTNASWGEAETRGILSTPFLARVTSKYALTATPELQGGPMRTPLERVRARLSGKTPALADDPSVAALRTRIAVRPEVPAGRLVITVRSYDPRFAALTANGIARSFVEESAGIAPERPGAAARHGGQRVTAGPDAGAVRGRDTPEARAARDQAGRRLTEERERAARASSEAATKRQRADALRRSSETGILESLEGAAGDAMRSTRLLLMETDARRADLEQSLGPRHPDVVAIHERLRRLRDALAAEAARVVRDAEATAVAAEREAEDARRARETAAGEVAALQERDTAAQATPAVPAASRVEESTVAPGAGTVWRVAVVASPPTRPASPDIEKNLRLGAVLGLFFGLSLALLRAHALR